VSKCLRHDVVFHSILNFSAKSYHKLLENQPMLIHNENALYNNYTRTLSQYNKFLPIPHSWCVI